MLATSACASPYVAVPYEPDQHDVTTVTLLEDVGDADVTAWEVASVGSNFGLIGALVDAGVQDSRRDRVREVLERADFNAQDHFRTVLTSELEALGYEVEVAQVSERDRLDLIASLPDSDENVHVYLDSYLGSYGFISSGAGTPFRPHASAEAQLVLRENGDVLMRNAVIYGPFGSPQGMMIISPNPEHAYRNREELLADEDRMVSAVRDAISESAQALASQLAR